MTFNKVLINVFWVEWILILFILCKMMLNLLMTLLISNSLDKKTSYNNYKKKIVM